MKQLNKTILLLTFLFLVKMSSGQWIKDNIHRTVYDSIVSSYTWDNGNMEGHVAWGSITLFKNNRYKFLLTSNVHKEVSEGTYSVIKDTLSMTSSFGENNLPIEVNYADTNINDKTSNKIGIAQYRNGQNELYAGYYINNDTTVYFPVEPINFRQKIDRIKIGVGKFYSEWIPIMDANRYIKIKILTDEDLYSYKVMKQERYLIVKGNLSYLIKEN